MIIFTAVFLTFLTQVIHYSKYTIFAVFETKCQLKIIHKHLIRFLLKTFLFSGSNCGIFYAACLKLVVNGQSIS